MGMLIPTLHSLIIGFSSAQHAVLLHHLKLAHQPLRINERALKPDSFDLVLKSSSIDVLAWKQKCYDAMNDDFNSPILIAQLFDAAKYINQIKEGKASISSEDLNVLNNTINIFVFDVLGLENNSESNSGTDKLSGAVDVLIKLRQEARANKDFALSDKIRDELAEVGIQLKDGKDGTTFSVN